LREAAIRTSTSPTEARWAHHTKIQAHLVQRKRDVLVGFGLDLDLQLLVAHAAGQDDFLGNDRRGRQRHGHVFGLGAALLDQRRMASATSSNFSMLPSVIQPRSSGSMAQRSSTRLPALSRPNSTSLTLDELISNPATARADG
jgi:hypothetical protein